MEPRGNFILDLIDPAIAGKHSGEVPYLSYDVAGVAERHSATR
jgi:hypothetical protein